MSQMTTTNSQLSDSARHVLDDWARVSGALPGADWLKSARARAAASIETRDIPSRKSESWRYTDLRAALGDLPEFDTGPKLGFSKAHAGLIAAAAKVLNAADSHLCVFVNGRFVADLSDIGVTGAGVEITPLGDVMADDAAWLKPHLDTPDSAFAAPILAVNTAFVTDGVAIRLQANATLEKPLALIFVTEGSVSAACRIIIDLADGATAQIREAHIGISDATTTSLISTDIRLGAAARLDHIRHQDEPLGNSHFSHARIDLAKEALYNGFVFSIGAGLARHEAHVGFSGEGANAELAGAFLVTGKQHCDTTIDIDHGVARCASDELFKGAIGGEARGVFQGKITVAPDAQKTDGRQMSRALLLSETAEFDAKPELKIYADDVQCAHGATAGEIDNDLLFYLRARGIPETQARAILATAFIGEAFDRIKDRTVADHFAALAHDWFAERKGLGHG
jgi:Fe-S cluster assembly protein SufD